MRYTLPKIICSFFILQLIVLSFCTAQTITSFTPTSGPVGTLVTINGSGLMRPSALTIGGVNAIEISNTGSKLVAMVMPNATTGAVGVGSFTSSNMFSVTANVLNTTQQGMFESSFTGLVNYSIPPFFDTNSISADGNTAIINNIIYVRSGSAWKQQGAALVSKEAAFLGKSSAISADGNTVIISGGDIYSNVVVCVFIRTNGIWLQQGKKLQFVNNIREFNSGEIIKISADGNTAIVSSSLEGWASLFTFKRNNGIWQQQGDFLDFQKPTPDWENEVESFDISADGKTLVVGQSRKNNDMGIVTVFINDGNAWKEQAKLFGTGGVGNTFHGQNLSISADGNTIAENGNGYLWIYRRTNGIWSQQGSKLIGIDALGVNIPLWEVAISADGNSLICGANGIITFKFNGSNWEQIGYKIIGLGFEKTTKSQGFDLALSADGSTILMGASLVDYNSKEKRAVFIFSGKSETLPIELSNYEAQLYQNNAVKILWSTASEHNNNYFELLKSTDGVNFQTIANIKSLGNSNSLQRYNFVDKFPANGNNYYKLVQTDLDGTRKEIGLKTVKFELENAAQISLYPNPVSNILNIGFGDGNYNTLEITDLLGRIILTKSINVKDKESTVNVAQLSQATYIINLRGKSGSISKQFVKN